MIEKWLLIKIDKHFINMKIAIYHLLRELFITLFILLIKDNVTCIYLPILPNFPINYLLLCQKFLIL